MTKRQRKQRRQIAPMQTAEARNQVRAAKALAELERLGRWQYFISRAGAA